MLVEGKLSCQIEINTEEAIKALYERFDIEYDYRYFYIAKEINGVKGVYYSFDTSYHETSDDEYTLLHKGEKACEIFFALNLLDEELENTVKESEEEKKLEYCKKN